ncbi:MAG TPA: hybrid sensor histidine kinase/response regulator [Kofleriaceae bacterium]|nr:hybrid sensor histidine kinase/response regulator [Kofleriaceae bacterium]
MHEDLGHPDATPAQILIVDDKPANLLALEAILEPLRRPIVCATSGEAALRAVLETDFAVILMDVRMPDLDGMEAASLIRERERSCQVPIIFVTAEPSDLDQIRHAYALGGVDYVTKPLDPLIMRSKVRAFIQLHEQADALRRHAVTLAAESGRRVMAERLVQSKDLSIGILGHDLRSPLAVLQTGLDILKATPRNAEHMALLGRMDRCVGRMERMVGDILDFARVSVGGGMRVAPEPGNLEETVRDHIDDLRTSHGTREIQLESKGSLHGTYDAGRIAQVVCNLVGNALQHSTEGATRVVLDGSAGERLRLVVSNPGTIPSETLPRLFEPFRRGDDSSNGLGLGLYIVREIARAHDGTVEVEIDRARAVTTFVFEIPRTPDGSSTPT